MSELPILTIDFEGKSRTDITKAGAWRYSVDPSTDALCMAYRFKGDTDDPAVWTPLKKGFPKEIQRHIDAGGLIEAHNSFFEFCFWLNVMVPKYGWPEPPPHNQWRCSMAKASVAAMPRSLAAGCEAMGLSDGKDKTGKALINKLCIPIKRGERKGEFDWNLWDWLALIKYCQQDVRAEEALSDSLPDLTAREQTIWELDRKINLRGVKLDIAMARRCIELSEETRDSLNKPFKEITGIERTTMRAKAKAWMSERLLDEVPNTQVDTLTKLRATVEDDKVRLALDLMLAANKTSIGKYKTMLEQVDPNDQRVHGLLIHHGATTGRWTASGVQLHNLPRGTIKALDMDAACVDLMTLSRQELEMLYGPPMALLSAAIRGALTAPEGKLLLAADYNAIEARSLSWLADDKVALKVFESGVSIYIDMATELYGRPIDKKKDPAEYNFGKVAILGLGYGMGYITFFNHCRSHSMNFSKEMCRKIMGGTYDYWCDWVVNKINDPENTDDVAGRIDEIPMKVVHELALMKYVVTLYRDRYSAVTDLWEDMEMAAIRAVRHDTKIFRCAGGKVAFRMQGKWLCCRLPSGRVIRYYDPKISKTITPWGEKKPTLSYMAVRDGKWRRVFTYGGKLAENITQATARDVLCDALIRMDEASFWIMLHVHDEGVAEVDEADARHLLDKCVKIMEASEVWCKTLPVAVEAEFYKRYRK